MGHFLGLKYKEQKGLEFCFSPIMLTWVCHLSPQEQTASFSSLPTAIHPSLCSSPVAVPAGRGCQVPCLLAASRFPAVPHTNTAPHALPCSHTEPQAHVSTFFPSFSLSQPLTSTSPWNVSGKTLLIQQGRIVLISLCSFSILRKQLTFLASVCILAGRWGFAVFHGFMCASPSAFRTCKVLCVIYI